MNTLSQKIRLIASPFGRLRTGFLGLALALAPMLIAQTHSTGSGQATVEFSISWSDNSTNETGFAVYYSLQEPQVNQGGAVVDLQDRQLLASTSADEASAALQLPAGQKYWLAVLAFNEYGESGYTNPLPLDFTPPDGRPGNLQLDGPVVTTVSGNLRITGDLIVAGTIHSESSTN